MDEERQHGAKILAKNCFPLIDIVNPRVSADQDFSLFLSKICNKNNTNKK